MTPNYWKNKDDRRQKAINWKNKMNRQCEDSITYSVENSIIYDDQSIDRTTENGTETEFYFENMTSVAAIFKMRSQFQGKTAVLNFASYKNPGGMFLNGSSAQEESLCHSSTLYNVLSQFNDRFYYPNRKRLNRSLYSDNLIYSPEILFFLAGEKTTCDVITCAAPNKAAAQKYHNVSGRENYEVLQSRIAHIIAAAKDQKVKNLIIGAFGCGVFGNDAREVGHVFSEELSNGGEHGIENVMIAIPKFNPNDYTMELFKEGFHDKVQYYSDMRI